MFVENTYFFCVFFGDFLSFLTILKKFSTFSFRFLLFFKADFGVVIHRELLENKGVATFPPCFLHAF